MITQSFEPNKFLEPVKKDYKKLEEEFLRLEPNKVEEKKYSLAIERIRTQWHVRRDSNSRPPVPKTGALSS